MLQPKLCHQGLRPTSKMFGLEPLDAMLLFPCFYVCAVLLGHLVLGLGLCLVMAAVIRIVKWGRLPGYSLDLILYLTFHSSSSALGYDHAPLYPRARGRI